MQTILVSGMTILSFRSDARTDKSKPARVDRTKKPVKQIDASGKVVKVYVSLADAAKEGFNPSRISRCCHGLNEAHRGYKWAFK
jgi:hypothetical protein